MEKNAGRREKPDFVLTITMESDEEDGGGPSFRLDVGEACEDEDPEDEDIYVPPDPFPEVVPDSPDWSFIDDAEAIIEEAGFPITGSWHSDQYAAHYIDCELRDAGGKPIRIEAIRFTFVWAETVGREPWEYLGRLRRIGEDRRLRSPWHKASVFKTFTVGGESYPDAESLLRELEGYCASFKGRC